MFIKKMRIFALDLVLVSSLLEVMSEKGIR